MKESNSHIILQQRELYPNTPLPNVLGNDNALQLFTGAMLEIHTLHYRAAVTFCSDEGAAAKCGLEKKYLDPFSFKRKRGNKVFSGR